MGCDRRHGGRDRDSGGDSEAPDQSPQRKARWLDIKDYITGFGSQQWKKTHEAAEKTAVVVTTLLRNRATCVAKTIMDEMGFGITGENKHYGTPINPLMPSNVLGGCSSGSAVSVAAELVDFALGIDTTVGVRIPASFCGILRFRPSQGTVSSVGVLPNSQSLETVGWFAYQAPKHMNVGQYVASNVLSLAGIL
ncbi:hypothetical protein Bca4012_011668 [Brassica carinata]